MQLRLSDNMSMLNYDSRKEIELQVKMARKHLNNVLKDMNNCNLKIDSIEASLQSAKKHIDNIEILAF